MTDLVIITCISEPMSMNSLMQTTAENEEMTENFFTRLLFKLYFPN